MAASGFKGSYEEWKANLEESASLGEDSYQKVTAAFATSQKPILQAVASQQQRDSMARRVRLQQKESATNQVPLQTGDRVLVKATQYTQLELGNKSFCATRMVPSANIS